MPIKNFAIIRVLKICINWSNRLDQVESILKVKMEKYSEKLLPRSKFILRVLRSMALAGVMIALSLWVGMAGYHHLEKLPWIDSYANAAMILSGMGPLWNPLTFWGKLFAGSYALFCGLIFIFIVGIILTPIIHRLYHYFHLEDEKEEKERSSKKEKGGL